MTLRAVLAAATAVTLAGAVAPHATAGALPALSTLSGRTVGYHVVVAGDGHQAWSAVRAAGGTVVRSNTAVGLLTVTAPENGFTARLADEPSILVAAPVRAIGSAPATGPAAGPVDAVAPDARDQAVTEAATPAVSQVSTPAVTGLDPLDAERWNLPMVHADQSRQVQPGDRRVRVGVLDTGVDGTHPDLAPNFDRGLSRNFVTDIPFDELGQEVDGPCEFAGCVDPVDHDDAGHGTHVAGIIASAADGFGISGVAPNVTIVNIRAGQDSGKFFLQPVVDALTYAADAGLDVVNMSFFVDPWLYNCQNNPADSPEQQAQQRATTIAMTRALNYAHGKGVTQVVSIGNQNSDLGRPQPDLGSPNYPEGTSHPRQIDNATCLSLPIEGPHTIGVSSLGPSKTKSAQSNYGLEQISVSAPGGFLHDFFGTPQYLAQSNRILSTFPRNVAFAEGWIDADGNLTPQAPPGRFLKATKADGTPGYYWYAQNTSMAAPHAAAVAALIVSEHGRFTGGQASMSPDRVRAILENTAEETPCPEPRTVDYLPDDVFDERFTATCEGSPSFNGFYGHGIVDAYAAVS
jgi:subtilisin family serine protease